MKNKTKINLTHFERSGHIYLLWIISRGSERHTEALYKCVCIYMCSYILHWGKCYTFCPVQPWITKIPSYKWLFKGVFFLYKEGRKEMHGEVFKLSVVINSVYTSFVKFRPLIVMGKSEVATDSFVFSFWMRIRWAIQFFCCCFSFFIMTVYFETDFLTYTWTGSWEIL